MIAVIVTFAEVLRHTRAVGMDPVFALRGDCDRRAFPFCGQDVAASAGAQPTRPCSAHAGAGRVAAPRTALAALWAIDCRCRGRTAMLNLYEDAQAKLGREFRNYGANIMVVGRGGSSFPPAL